MAALVVEPRRSVTFDQFCDSDGPAVALDGYVAGPPRHHGRHATFDHHGDVARLELPATCCQVLAAIDGHHPVVSPGAGTVTPDLRVCVNDCDPDVAFSVWMLQHPERTDSSAVRALTALEGELDAHGGMARHIDIVTLAELCWVVEPWADRFADMALLGASEMVDIIDSIGERLDAYAAGTTGDTRAALRATFHTLDRRGDTWLIAEDHPLGRCAAAAAGADTIVSVRTGPRAGTRTISICSTGTHVDLNAVWRTLNSIDSCAGADTWGGCDVVGGSPRDIGTTLDDDTILAAIDAHRHS